MEGILRQTRPKGEPSDLVLELKPRLFDDLLERRNKSFGSSLDSYIGEALTLLKRFAFSWRAGDGN